MKKTIISRDFNIFCHGLDGKKVDFLYFTGKIQSFYHTQNYSVVEHGIQHVCTTYVCTHLHVFVIHRVVYDFKEVTRSMETIEKDVQYDFYQIWTYISCSTSIFFT